MQIKTSRQNAKVTAKLYGELDHHTAQEFKEKLDKLVCKKDVDELVLDLENLNFMDSSGIGVLIGRYRKLKARGASLSVKNANPQVDKIFHVAGLYQIIHKVK